MRILYASSEIAPFAKTSGLADVSRSLTSEFANLGHDVTLVMPAYRGIERAGYEIRPTRLDFNVPIGGKIVPGKLLHARIADDKLNVYLIDQPEYFDRDELYQENDEPYRDNCERFVFFSRAVLEAARLLELDLDLIHCNDWQTGLIPALLKIECSDAERFRDVASLLTIHNLATQGSFWHWDMLLTGLDWKYFNWHQMECYGRLNLLKTGIVFADSINTVSPRYALEIQGSEFGCGLEGVLQQHREVLSGIVNGIDYSNWNPASDEHLPRTYDAADWQEGKAACKSALQEEVGLPVDPDVPLIGIVGSLTDDKGWNLITAVMEQWMPLVDAQWVILGVGERKFQQALSTMADEYPEKLSVQFRHSDPLAHRIKAGSDIDVMTSRFEPCGGNQLQSLRYGAVPVVRETGGLADTVVDATEDEIESRSATGFSFESFDADSLDAVLRQACDAFRYRPEVWSAIVETGMHEDWSWNRTAHEYLLLYESTVNRHRSSLEK